MSKILARRCDRNPLLIPDEQLLWQARAVFNACPVDLGEKIGLLYRAESEEQEFEGRSYRVSTIGYAESNDRNEISGIRQFISPSESFDKFGCEDPRVTKIDDQYLIFYTALSDFPPSADSIKVGLAISPDLKTVAAKHLVTPFNAKAMVLFPEKINGQYVAILTVNTDRPPSSIALVRFDRLEQIWDQQFWCDWYATYEEKTLPIQRLNTDHVEVGAVPVKTSAGWIMVYAHIQHYQNSEQRIFGIEAVLLDLDDPSRIIGRTTEPFLQPELEYERKGVIPNVIFPSGAIIRQDELRIYYGAADTVVAMARLKLDALLSYLQQNVHLVAPKLIRFRGNPILTPIEQVNWRAQAVFNSAAVYANDKFHLLYRAMSPDNTSTIGYASSRDGFNFDEQSLEPVYIPRMSFEQKTRVNDFSGCEDPRLTLFEDRFYMFYTAYDGIRPPQVALTSIAVADFARQEWLWSEPILISDPTTDNKNACLFPRKIKDKFVILHRVLGQDIAIDLVDDLEFKQGSWLEKEGLISARAGHWDSAKIGIAGPPMETERGWLLIYHGVSQEDKNYRLGYMVLDLEDPFKIIFRSEYPILEPVKTWEKEGIVNNVVFSCGSVIKDGKVFVYYGGADKAMGVATIALEELLCF